jgi:CHAD domain-containing protein
VSALVRAYRRTAPLVPVARLRTTRRSSAVVDADGTKLAEVDDDIVAVLELDPTSERLLAAFREVEVELAEGTDPAVLDAIVARLIEAGAGAADKTPKMVRALGPRALAPPDVVVHELGDDARAGEVLRAAVAGAAVRIIDHDPVVRLDAGVEGVHQMRVGARHLRSDLRTFGDLVTGDWSDHLRAELSWLADLLGPVRDADVLAELLRTQASALDEAATDDVDAILALLRTERDEALATVIRELGSDRYGKLLDRLVEAAAAPALTDLASAPAAEVIPALAANAWKKLEKAVAGLGKNPNDDQLHKVRILAKRARYAADVAVPVVGKPAKQHSKELGELQDALGAHQDASVAETWLRRIVPGLTVSQALVSGQLIGMRRGSVESAQRGWQEAWARASDKKVTAWLR